MFLSIIVALAENRVIGRGGDLPWHLSADLKRFKRLTMGHSIIMGRKTWDSIGFPLPKRQSIVLTRDPNWSAEGAHVIHHPDELSQIELITPEVFIIGGAQIYSAFMPMLDEILISHVYESYEGDTQFPAFEADFPNVTVEEKYETFELRRYTR